MVYTATVAAGTNHYNRIVCINVWPPLSITSVCVCRLGNYWFRDSKLVEGFLSYRPHTSSMYRSTYRPTHPALYQYVVWYGSKAQYRGEKPIQQKQPTNRPCITIQQQQSSSPSGKNISKIAGTRGFELTYLELAKQQ